MTVMKVVCSSSSCWELDMQNCSASSLSRSCQSAPSEHPERIHRPTLKTQGRLQITHRTCASHPRWIIGLYVSALLDVRTRSIIHQIFCLTACPCKSATAQLWLRLMHHAGIIFSKNRTWHYRAVHVRQVIIFWLLCFLCDWAVHCSYIVQYLFPGLIQGKLEVLCLLKHFSVYITFHSCYLYIS